MRRREFLSTSAEVISVLGTGLGTVRAQSESTNSQNEWLTFGFNTRNSGFRTDISAPTDGASANVLKAIGEASTLSGDRIDNWYHMWEWSDIVVSESRIYYAGPIHEQSGRDKQSDTIGALIAVDRSTGEEVWRYLPEDRRALYGGIVLDGETVVVGQVNAEFSEGDLFGVNAKNGTERWRTTVPGGIRRPMKSYDGTVYVSSEKVPYSPTTRSLAAVDIETGDVKWDITGDELPDWRLRTVPAVDDTGVYVAVNWEMIVRYTHDGIKRWTKSIGGPILGSLAIDDQNVYATRKQKRGNRSHVVSLRKSNGLENWRYKTGEETGGVEWRPGVSDDAVYIATDEGALYCIDTSGKLQWKQNLGFSTSTPPTIVNDTVFIGAWEILVDEYESSGEFTEQTDCRMAAFHADHGRRLYTYPLDYPAISEIIATQDELTILEAGNDIHVLRPDGEPDTTPTPDVEIEFSESNPSVGTTLRAMAAVASDENDSTYELWTVTDPGGDTDSSTGDDIEIELSEPGEYVVEVWVKNTAENWNSASRTVRVEPTTTTTTTTTSKPNSEPTQTTSAETPGFGVLAAIIGGSGGLAYASKRTIDDTEQN